MMNEQADYDKQEIYMLKSNLMLVMALVKEWDKMHTIPMDLQKWYLHQLEERKTYNDY